MSTPEQRSAITWLREQLALARCVFALQGLVNAKCQMRIDLPNEEALFVTPANVEALTNVVQQWAAVYDAT